MNNRKMLIAVVILSSVHPCVAAPPVFYDTSPETTIVNLNAGQTSFLITGFVRDRDLNHTVSFPAVFGLQPFMRFEGTPGNPASFRITAENLTGAHYGAYSIDVVAADNGTPLRDATSYTFGVGILPEPVQLSVVLISCLLRGRARNAV